jgi:hypothetical protein
MTDRELLELAAKAAGIELKWHHSHKDAYARRNGEYWAVWNPLRDDGDALRLAVSLCLVVDCSRPSAGEPYKQHAIWRDELCDTATLTRRAIVRVAAEIGRGMT